MVNAQGRRRCLAADADGCTPTISQAVWPPVPLARLVQVGCIVGLDHSVDVEIAHQMVVLPIFIALKMIRNRAAPQTAAVPGRVLRYGSAEICVAGIFT